MAIYKTNLIDKTKLFSNENYKNINNDFWIVRFEDPKIEKYDYSFIDKVKQELSHVQAVVHLKGKVFYALFKKNQFDSRFELEESIKALLGKTEDILFTFVDNVRDFKQINPRHLAQLLFNSLASISEDTIWQNSNITGGLYWVVKTSKSKKVSEATQQRVTWQYITLKITLDWHLYLQLEVNTFSSLLLTGKKHMDFSQRKKQLHEYAQYEILNNDIRTMKRIKRHNCENPTLCKKCPDIYIRATPDGQKNTIKFLDFSPDRENTPYDNFQKSKCGVLYEFLREVKQHLSQYLNVSFLSLPFGAEKTEFDKSFSEKTDSKIRQFYRSKSIAICIADGLKGDEKAEILAENLKIFLSDEKRSYQAKDVVLGELDKEAINIRIIHNKKYYEYNDIRDEKILPGRYEQFLIHHITIEDFKFNVAKDSHPAIDVILKESFIKNDLLQKQLTIMDWGLGEWVFMNRIKVGDRYSKEYSFHVLKIDKAGKLEYANCEPNQLFEDEELNLLKTIFEEHDDWKKPEKIEGLVMSAEKDVNVIFNTPRFTIQAIEEIGDTLRLESKNTDLPKQKMLTMLSGFMGKHPEYEENEALQKIKSDVEEYNKDSIYKEKLNQLFTQNKLNNRTKIKKLFCQFYADNSEAILGNKDVLWHFFKGEDTMEDLFGAKTNIYYQIEEGKTEATYFVGKIPKSVQTGFIHATKIRKVKAVPNTQERQSKLVFDQLLETLNVDFVKQKGLTVVPFPFKYLNEFRRMKENKKNFVEQSIYANLG